MWPTGADRISQSGLPPHCHPKRGARRAQTLTPTRLPIGRSLERPSLDGLLERGTTPRRQPRLRVTMSRTSGDSDGRAAMRFNIASA